MLILIYLSLCCTLTAFIQQNAIIRPYSYLQKQNTQNTRISMSFEWSKGIKRKTDNENIKHYTTRRSISPSNPSTLIHKVLNDMSPSSAANLITYERINQIIDAYKTNKIQGQLPFSTTNSTIIFHTLLKVSIKSCYTDHVVTISHILLDTNSLSTQELNDALIYICEYKSHILGLELLDKAVSKKFELSIQVFAPLLKSCGSARNARKIFQRM